MKNGFVRVGCAAPRVRVADCAFNADKIIEIMTEAEREGIKLMVTPELSLTGYTCGDLYMQKTLQEGAVAALERVVKASVGLEIVIAVGLPVAYKGKLYNCGAIVQNGRILGVVPKTNLPNYAEFDERRHYAPAFEGTVELNLCGQAVAFGTKLLFECNELPEFVFATEICEDLWVPCPPSISHTRAGAAVIINLSGSDDIVGKTAFRHRMVEALSSRLICAYAYTNTGYGESTSDMVFLGQRVISENGVTLAETDLFSKTDYIYTEVDVESIMFERRRMSTYTFDDSGYTHIPFSLTIGETELSRKIAQSPFIPDDVPLRDKSCKEILFLQANGLARRIEHTHAKSLVIGLSGGLDSTLALLVCKRALEQLGRDPSDILAITMPCFGTTARTKGNAEILAECVGARLKTIDIAQSVKQHFKDIGHDENDFNVVYENAQARERTQILMDVANAENGLVIGTGDLSELALGWATFNGDHMSMYGVNSSLPKTYIRHLVRYEADNAEDKRLHDVLYDVLDTPVSPELLPAKDGKISQQTENIVGPYELHDFFLYYVVRCAFTPKKILRLAQCAFGERYDRATLLKWLKNFYKRFFSQQFKRSCMPEGPKVTAVSLSPRGDWHMPSDACSALWLDEIEKMEQQE